MSNTSTESLQDLWSNVKFHLKEKLPPSAFQTFASSVTPVSYIENNLTISIPNLFSKNWFIDFCEKTLLESFSTDEKPLIISYTITPSTPKEEQLSIFESKNKDIESNELKQQFNPAYTFDSFVVGQNNRFAHASCMAVAKSPAETYNPLFIYGSVGLGKTHLLHAIAYQVYDHKPDASILLISCETFTNDMINAIKDKRFEDFREK